jgi:hypothetical protein
MTKTAMRKSHHVSVLVLAAVPLCGTARPQTGSAMTPAHRAQICPIAIGMPNIQ